MIDPTTIPSFWSSRFDQIYRLFWFLSRNGSLLAFLGKQNTTAVFPSLLALAWEITIAFRTLGWKFGEEVPAIPAPTDIVINHLPPFPKNAPNRETDAFETGACSVHDHNRSGVLRQRIRQEI